MTISPKPWEALASGDSWRGAWPVGDNNLDPDLPVLAARGAHSGPQLLVTAGVHGDEYEGVAAIYALFDELDPAELNGTLVGIPVANIAAWNARTRFTPADGGDLNRSFPGRSGSETERMAEVIFEHFVLPCTALIDLHSGGSRLVHLPMAGWYDGGTHAEMLARSFGGTLHPWLIPDVPGVLSYEAHRIGKIALGLEWGGGGRLDVSGVSAYTAGLRRVMTGLEMLPPINELEVDLRPPIRGGYQTTPVGGLFNPDVALGDRVEAGGHIGTLRSALGDAVNEVCAEHGGTVAALPHIPLLREGDRVAYIG